RSYFGWQVGLYFAWLGFYTKMLIFAAIVGLISFFFGVFSKDRDITRYWPSPVWQYRLNNEYQQAPTKAIHKCHSWCKWDKIVAMYQKKPIKVFIVWCVATATVFLEFWKRRQASLAYRWDLTAAAQEGDPIRPEYLARCTTTKCNIITMETAQVLQDCKSHPPLCFLCYWQILLILAAILGVVVYRLSIFGILSSSIPNHVTKIKVIGALLTPDMVTTITASILNIVIILLLNKGYDKLSIHTATEYNASRSIESHTVLLVKWWSTNGPVIYQEPIKKVHCPKCEVSHEHMIAVKSDYGEVHNSIKSLCLYPVSLIILSLPPYPFSKYTPVIQFGFVTLFVASFPLAPLLALLNNIIEVRVDAWKLVTKMRRPVVSRARGIGAWADILSIVATLSVITNSCILAFTTDIIPRLVYYYGYSAEYGTGSPTMHGYTEDSLSIFKISDFKEQNHPNILPAIHTTCRYPGYRYPPDHPQAYSVTKQYWQVLTAKLAFVIAMQVHINMHTHTFIN
uniref:Anoctamin n=1 Tax=Petromyzon marinus TaxID=7757 RepID=S4RHX3_PETMA